MKHLPVILAAIVALAGSGHARAAEKPNVVFILSDDQAWTD
jgi:hypothetical protein